MSESSGNVLIAGAHGVLGRAVTERLAHTTGWKVTTAARRGPLELPASAGPVDHLSVDLLDPDATGRALEAAGNTTHLVYAAYLERPTMAETVGPNIAMLRNTLDGLERAGAPLRHVVLTGGGKSYGEHLGPYKTPARESDPRFLGPIFYNDQEDELARRAGTMGFGWTVLRPDVVIGLSIGSPMNLLMSLAVYATLCGEAGVPLRFPGKPGTWTALHQFTDAELFAEATEWALTESNAHNQIFNVLNGDLFRWRDLWDELAAFFDMPTAPPQPMSLVDQMSDKKPAWDRLVDRNGLRPVPWERIASWPFLDGVLGSDYDMVQSTIKLRQAGFHGCRDTYQSLRHHLTLLREQGYIP